MISCILRKSMCISRNVVVTSLRQATGISTSQEMVKVLTYVEVNEKLKNPSTLLLDVREPAELKNDGVISRAAKNVPVGEVPSAFNLPGEDFNDKYGFPKPPTSEYIIVHCKAGVRAQTAAKSMFGLGYSNVEVYPGTMDWVENGGKLVK